MFSYVNYYTFCEGITRFHLCRMKVDVCPEIRCGYIVDDIIVYDDGQLDIFVYGRKYTTRIKLWLEIPSITYDIYDYYH